MPRTKATKNPVKRSTKKKAAPPPSPSPPPTSPPPPTPTLCPVEGCRWKSTAEDRNRALLRHLQYISTTDNGNHPQQQSHKQVQQGRRNISSTTEEKKKQAQKKYREMNREKRCKAAQLSGIKKKLREKGETDEEVLRQKAMEIWEEKHM